MRSRGFTNAVLFTGIGMLTMCGTGCQRQRPSPVTGLYIDTTGSHPSLLVILKNRHYVHCVYRRSMHKYIADTGKWSWYTSGGHRRLSFDNFRFYNGDRDGYSRIHARPGPPGFWCVPVGRDWNGRARLCLDVDAFNRYFVWRLPASGVDSLAAGLARKLSAAVPTTSRKTGWDYSDQRRAPWIMSNGRWWQRRNGCNE
jgi:hypothetical protein